MYVDSASQDRVQSNSTPTVRTSGATKTNRDSHTGSVALAPRS